MITILFSLLPMGPPVLVQDVVDIIIDSVDSDDLGTLRQCFLVATSWVHRSQSHIFRTIDWTWGCVRFSKWLQTVGPKRDDLLSHTLNLYLFDLLDSEGQVLELCKFPRLRAFQNVGRLHCRTTGSSAFCVPTWDAPFACCYCTEHVSIAAR